MTLLVADDGRSVPPALPADAVAVGAEAVGDTVAADDPDVVVVDEAAVSDPAAVVREVRDASEHAAIVLVGADDDAADVTCPDRDAAIRAAVDRAERVAAYRRSVEDLYEACRDRALGRPDGDVRTQRREADDHFAALPADEETFAALLRSESDDPDHPASTDGPAPEDQDG